MQILTIGHSNRTWDQFVALLQAHDVALLVDVRSFPGSRKWPQFNSENMAAALPDAGIRYLHLQALGGYRKMPITSDANAGWEHPSFRSYADYTASPDFAVGLQELMRLAEQQRVACCCSEAVWWRCHRRIISDHLKVAGCDVQHIMGLSALKPHVLTPFAHLEGSTITYPAPVTVSGE